MKVTRESRYQGCLLGLAAGDALGTTLEFKSPGSFHPIDDMVGGGPFGLAPGYWTDDTSMALCLADSLIATRGFDPADQMTRYLRWFKEGYLSSTGECFDIGNTVRAALNRFEQDGAPNAGSTYSHTAGNGSLMRLAPIPMAYADDPACAIFFAAEMSRTTHGTAECVDACRYYAGLIVAALDGESKDELLSERFTPFGEPWEFGELSWEVERVANGSFKRYNPPAIKGTGYVVDALEAALWAFHTTDNFRDGALAAVNLGDDADTTGAIYGQLAGAYYGVDAIPDAWRKKLVDVNYIRQQADALLVGGFLSRF